MLTIVLSGSVQASECKIYRTACQDILASSETSGFPPRALEWVSAYLTELSPVPPNKSFVAIFDVSQRSNHKRFFMLNLLNGQVSAHLAAHGRGSDPDHDGWADQFSDVPGSRMTPLGFFKTGESYHGRHGLSLRLHGLEGRNRNALDRAIVIHGADYVSESRGVLGRSWGCPALSNLDARHVIDALKGGAILFIYRGEDRASEP